MKPLVLMFDLDGTIVDIMTSLCIFLKCNHKWEWRPDEYPTPENITSYGFTNFPPEIRTALFQTFARENVFGHARAYPYALETVEYFLNRPESYKVKIVTHLLPEWEYAYREKFEWVQRNLNIDMNNDYMVLKNRANLIYDVLIDDCLDNIWQCAERFNTDTIVPDRPWNQGPLPPNAFRFADWREIKSYISRILPYP